MILRNLQLNENDRRELNTYIFDRIRKRPRSNSLTLNQISTSHDDCDCEERQDSPSCKGLNCDFLMGSNHIKLEELVIERCSLDLEGARVLERALQSESDDSAISTLKSLKMLNLSVWDDTLECSEIWTPVLRGLVAAGDCLESLEFRKIAFEGMQSKFFSSLGQCQNLKTLKLNDCCIFTEDVVELANALALLSDTLESLDLSKNHIDGKGLKILLQSLAHHKRLKRLVLSDNPLGDDGAVHLTNFLSQQPNDGLESLLLVECDLWSAGCHTLAHGLQDFSSLRQLVLGGEWEDHLEALAKSLRTNVVLKDLLVVSQQQTWEEPLSETMQEIQFYLNLNRGHRKISIDENLSFKLWPQILGTKQRSSARNPRSSTDLWYHLLRRRPELVATEWN